MKVLKHPIFAITFFVAFGIIAGQYLQNNSMIIFVTAGVAIVLLAVSYFLSVKQLIQKADFFYCTLLLSFSVGALASWMHYEPNNKLHYSHFIHNAEAPVIKGVISERLKPNQYYDKYYLEIKAIDAIRATGRILVTVPKDSLFRHLHPGDVLYIADNPVPINKPLNPYQFNYAGYMANQNVFHQLRLKGNYIITGKEMNADYYLDVMRSTLINSFDIHKYSSSTKSMINALLLGQRQDMDKETNEDYTNAGVVHILAISGLHFATLFFLLNFLLKPLRQYSRRGHLWQLIIVLAVLWVFALITGFSASIVRSVVMFTFIGIGTHMRRRTSIYNCIAVSALVLLMAKPDFIFDVGFQLSYAAVLGIVVLQPVYSRYRTSKYKLVNLALDTVVISFIAQLGVLPLTLYYFHQFPVLFLVANIVVIPLSTIVLVLALAVLLLNFLVPPVAVVVGMLLSFLIDCMNGFTKWIASFDVLVLKDIPFTLSLNIALYILIVLFSLWLYKKSFIRTAALLASVLLLQSVYMVTMYDNNNQEELVVFNNRKGSLLAVKGKGKTIIYSTDSLALQQQVIRDYSKESFSQKIENMPLKNLLWYNNKKILIIDSTGIYPDDVKPDIVLLAGSPKLNLERMLTNVKPHEVVADATSFKTYIRRWRETCNKAGIPFHATTEEGAYILK